MGTDESGPLPGVPDASTDGVSCSCNEGCDCRNRPAAADGGARPSNVDSEGNLINLTFKTPAEGKSQDISQKARADVYRCLTVSILIHLVTRFVAR